MSDESRPPQGPFNFELDPERIEENLRDLGEKVRRLVQNHRYSRVRLSWKGKPLLPDIPVALFVAGEVASFWWAGPLRVLLLNLGVGSIITVELVNESDEKVEQGKELFMDGDVEAAEATYREALRMKPGSATALYNLAVLLRVTGRVDEARSLLIEASGLGEHPDAVKASELLDKIGRGDKQLPR
jgi:tetratricopeptide (TPR) repeat protein